MNPIPSFVQQVFMCAKAISNLQPLALNKREQAALNKMTMVKSFINNKRIFCNNDLCECLDLDIRTLAPFTKKLVEENANKFIKIHKTKTNTKFYQLKEGVTL